MNIDLIIFIRVNEVVGKLGSLPPVLILVRLIRINSSTYLEMTQPVPGPPSPLFCIGY